MSFTEKEIYGQYNALQKTYQLFEEKEQDIRALFREKEFSSISFIGCGSSYSLAKSAAASASVRLDIPAYAYAAGDIMLNLPSYLPVLKNTLMVAISRSGSTSEVLMAVEAAQEALDVTCVSICAQENALIEKLADLSLEMPWAFDESVCQTRCVTNLYTANLLFIAACAGDKDTYKAVVDVISMGESHLQKITPEIQSQAKKGWSNVVVLADGELGGIAEEGALAFTEISLLSSRYFHLMDVRHGPIVLIDENTLVVAAITADDEAHQYKLLEDIKARGATVVTFGTREEVPHSDCHISVQKQEVTAAYGILFIALPQLLSYYKAKELNINPDQPTGLDPWIKL